jgi:CheY-like chemotaxis protein
MISRAAILGARILVVDDMNANILLLEGMLRVAGYTAVESTTDPTTVGELYRQNRYSLVLLDLQMPVMDGFEVMEKLREIEGDGYLPVIAITAQPGHKLRALEAGAKDFVGKPFDMAELRARVHNIVEVCLYSAALRETVRELEASREVIRVKTIAEQKKHERELKLAQETQESLLPHFVPQFEKYRVQAFNSPTRYVGGDFYDFLQLNPTEWMGVLADVSGKGIPAALLSSMVLGALGTEFRSGTPADQVLNRVNRLLCEKSLESQFVTLFLFLLTSDGDGLFISAGHNPAWLFRSATGKIENLRADAPVLGVLSGATYQHRGFHLAPGDLLVIYSDGLTDAEDPAGEMLGEQRLREILRREASSGGKAVEQAFLRAIDDFTQGTPQTDDITFMIIDRYE